MITIIKIIKESIIQAFQQLVGSKLRSFLSLLGITIGIFCIIIVLSAVDSLESNVRSSFDKLGDDVIYVDKQPWDEDPGSSWWKYFRRPNPNFQEFELIKSKAKGVDLACYTANIGNRTVKYRSNSVSGGGVAGGTYDFAEMYNVVMEKGRYYTPSEYSTGANKVILGHTVTNELFGGIEPIGKKISINGIKLEVIGVIEKGGEDLLQVMQLDDVVLISYNLARKFAKVDKNNRNTMLAVKAKEGVNLDDLEDEITGLLRSSRRLKPKEDSNFALNKLTMLSSLLDGFFGIMYLVGGIIGGFALFVGMFSVANIMFVSVKERTNIIGIKKALGAKKYVILLEFLIEAIILCLIGGAVGLLMVMGALKAVSMIPDMAFEMYLSADNAIFGITVSIIIGILAGVIPAFLAARMDPVSAIRA
ncbi:MAG: ABC transporter permease [Saprospiraceae bacterium]